MIKSYFIEQEWMDKIRGGVFYYPASGQDLAEPIEVFSGYSSEMHFCDIRYCDLEMIQPALPTPPDRIEFVGPRNAELIRTGRTNEVVLGKRIEFYTANRKHPLRIVRRRGFGQMGLVEFSQSSISIFMHRGDSQGEGGSNAFFLADRKKRHPPLSHLFSKLQARLRDRALIITDGSNCDIKFIKEQSAYLTKSVCSNEVFSKIRGKKFSHGDYSWECVGWLSERYGPTLVWGVTAI